MVLLLPQAVTILLRRPRFIAESGRLSNLPKSFAVMFLSQAHNSITWMVDLSFGAILGGGNARSLLDASPLRHFLNKHLECDRIQENIKRGHLYALAISTTNFNSGKSYLFIQGMKGHPIWKRVRLVTVATKITVDHVCASCAIPFRFPAGKTNNPASWVRLLRRWLCAPSTTSQPGNPPGGREGFRDWRPLWK